MDDYVSGGANTASNSANLNQAATHDTSLYDPDIHDNQIVALYADDGAARAAQEVLTQSGFPASAMQILARDVDPIGVTGPGAGYEHSASEGFWGAIKSLFVPEEDRTTFNHAIAHGHSMLVVTPDNSMDRQHLVHVIESTHPLDFDAKLEEWRQAGYDSSSAMTTATIGGNTAPKPQTTTDTGADTAANDLGTGYVAAPAPNSPASLDSSNTDAAYRTGRRDTTVANPRVRSYYTDRSIDDASRTVEGRASSEAGSPASSAAGSLPSNIDRNPNATPGASTSGANSPRT